MATSRLGTQEDLERLFGAGAFFGAPVKPTTPDEVSARPDATTATTSTGASMKNYDHIETPSIPADDPIFTAGVIFTAPVKPTTPEEKPPTAGDDGDDDEPQDGAQ